MENENLEAKDEHLDRATAARLGKLRSTPVDPSRLERMIQAQIPRPEVRGAFRITHWLRPFRAVAASLLIVGIIGALLISTVAHPVVASAAEMAQFHDDMVSGRVGATRVDSIEAANKTLAAQWSGSPQIPNVPMDHVMACCMRSVKNKKVACVLLEDSGAAAQSPIPVTLTVANASDMQAPSSPVVTRNSIVYHVQAVGRLNMVMTERNGRWICLIATLPAERLMDLGSNLQF